MKPVNDYTWAISVSVSFPAGGGGDRSVKPGPWGVAKARTGMAGTPPCWRQVLPTAQGHTCLGAMVSWELGTFLDKV